MLNIKKVSLVAMLRSALTGKRVKADDDSAIKDIHYSTITHLILKVVEFLQPTTTTLKSR